MNQLPTVAQRGRAAADTESGHIGKTRWRIAFTPRFEHELGSNFTGFAQLNANYQSSQGFDLNQDPLLKQDSYTLVDFSLGMMTNDDRYRLTLFVKNLSDEHYYTSMGHALLLATPANPFDIYANIDKASQRYFGATLEARF